MERWERKKLATDELGAAEPQPKSNRICSIEIVASFKNNQI
jgi:hypothetical protein